MADPNLEPTPSVTPAIMPDTPAVSPEPGPTLIKPEPIMPGVELKSHPVELPQQPLTDAEKAAAQAKIDNLKAVRDLKIKGTLGDPTLADGREIGKIDSELASLGANPEPRPSYLGSPQGWETPPQPATAETPVIVSAPEIPISPEVPAIPMIPVSDNAPKQPGLWARLFGGLFSRQPKQTQTEAPQTIAESTPQIPVASNIEETKAA